MRNSPWKEAFKFFILRAKKEKLGSICDTLNHA